MSEHNKYVVVLAHADGWGALSANMLVRHIHDHFPDIGIHLVVSRATKNKDGEIATKLGDLRIVRALKETNLGVYFEHIDAIYRQMLPHSEVLRQVDDLYRLGSVEISGLSPENRQDHFFNLGVQIARYGSASQFTFNQLAQLYCESRSVFYTTKGGFKGGEEVATYIETLETQHGYGPEVLLSADTMAILPQEVLQRYDCISAHPGPLDTIKIEGMQATLRSLINQIFYNADGSLLPRDYSPRIGSPHIKGTLFLQHPELDKGPPIESVLAPICPGMCAYQVRDTVYAALIDRMLELLPILLDRDARGVLVKQATKAKQKLDAEPHTRVSELKAEQLAEWQSHAVGFKNDTYPWGVEVIQNTIIDPGYFKNIMRSFFPGSDDECDAIFRSIFDANVEMALQQRTDHLEDPWARLFSGDKRITIKRIDPKTLKVIATFRNPSKRRGAARTFTPG